MGQGGNSVIQIVQCVSVVLALILVGAVIAGLIIAFVRGGTHGDKEESGS